ncbi:MAG: mandelate racemase/muconate lactonizing enzyme family protein [Alphaproteobacteria bacterium]|nr:mandelate racemase/muconate lactonizing enzyme family protein [Alphaproteobacteria bacterium]
MGSPIERIEVIPLRIPEDKSADSDGTVDTVLVVLGDAEGRIGIGESDAPPEVVKAYIEMPTAHIWSRNSTHMLLGSDPVEITAIWERLYDGTLYPGRRGLGIHALSAIDIALHDLAGKQLGLPAYKLMGGARRERLRPYCTIFPGMPMGRTLRQLLDLTFRQFERALAIGFRTLKMEVLYFDLVTDRELAAAVAEGRRALGPDIAMAVDFGYRWSDWRQALATLERIAEHDILFAEATLQHDDLVGHARLAGRSPIPVCGAEFAATRFEIKEWLDVAKVDIVQPDISRCGGLTEIRRIAELAAMGGAQVIPHGWKTGILAACGRHFQAACPASPLFEFISPKVYESPLREHLVGPEPEVKDGTMDLPSGVGLGVELDWGVVERYRVKT